MTEHTYPLELLRAELKSAMAEQLVQLVDRFASKRDLEAFRSEFGVHLRDDEQQFREINDKLDLLLGEKNHREGFDTARKTWLDSRRFVVTTIVTLLCVLISAIATLAWMAAGH